MGIKSLALFEHWQRRLARKMRAIRFWDWPISWSALPDARRPPETEAIRLSNGKRHCPSRLLRRRLDLDEDGCSGGT
jgi:hypothetical protein